MEAIVRELYALDRDAYVRARDERARALRAAGEAEAARAVARLPKPTVAAWVVDLLAGSRPEPVAALLALGDAVRQAQAQRDATQMRLLVEDQRRQVGALVREAEELAADRGTRVSDSVSAAVEATLRAALADPAAAYEVRSGTLARELEPGGFPLAPLPSAPPVPPPSAGEAGVGAHAAQAVARAAEAEQVAQQAERESADAAYALASLREHHAEAQRQVERLRAALVRSQDGLLAADEALRQAVEAAQEASDRAAEARVTAEELRSAASAAEPEVGAEP
jgi:hypothetical protein